jgi:hypothetical protein
MLEALQHFAWGGSISPIKQDRALLIEQSSPEALALRQALYHPLAPEWPARFTSHPY